jgi:hypothetical protein
MKSVLVLAFSNLKHDTRISRQLHWLQKHYRVTVVCFDGNPENTEVIKIDQTALTLVRKGLLAAALTLRIFSLAYRLLHDYSKLVPSLQSRKFDLIIANDIDTLPLAFSIKGNSSTQIVFDAHEYAPRHFEDKKLWRMFFQPLYLHLCRKYIPKVDGMLTVGKGLADEYEKNFGIKPVIITNATRYHDTAASEIKPDTIRLIHHGIANPSRKLELMIDMMDLLDKRFTLDMILMTSDFASAQTKSYINGLKERVAKNPKIRIIPPVKSHEVVPLIQQYDIGVFLIPPINFNYANTLPNKLFEYFQARLGIAIGPTPEMAAIVKEYNIGVVSDDFTAENLAAKLNSVTEADLRKFKTNAEAAAKALNAEKNEETFNALMGSLLK